MKWNQTINYYEQHVEDFIRGTEQNDMSPLYKVFEAHLPPEGAVLDLGCGSGRDSRYFKEHGFQVTALDASPAMCRYAEQIPDIEVRNGCFQDMTDRETFDGIWACASLLHVEKSGLPDVLKRLWSALRCGGVLYASFKHGTEEYEKEGRFFSDQTEPVLRKLFRTAGFEIMDIWLTDDVRTDRQKERWINILCRKQDKKIVLFGDSLTDYFPMEFFQVVKAQVYNRGEAGNTAPEMTARVSRNVVPFAPDIVLMQGGANDYLLPFYRGAETVAEQLVRAADRIRKYLPETKLYIQSLYPMNTLPREARRPKDIEHGMPCGYTLPREARCPKDIEHGIPFWSEGKSNHEIQRINSVIQKLCKDRGYYYVDVFAGLAGEDGELPLSYTVDGVHLSREGYEQVWTVLSQVLIKEGCMGGSCG